MTCEYKPGQSRRQWGWHGRQTQARIDRIPRSRQLKKAASSPGGANDDDAAAFISESDTLEPRKKAKVDHEERIGGIASIARGSVSQEMFGLLTSLTRKGRRKEAAASSSANRERVRKKPIMMAMGSNGVGEKK
jgi:protein SDA1